MKIFVLISLGFAVCTSETQKREAEPSYGYPISSYTPVTNSYPNHYHKRSADPSHGLGHFYDFGLYKPKDHYNPHHHRKRSDDPKDSTPQEPEPEDSINHHQGNGHGFDFDTFHPLPISFGNPFTKRSVDYLADPSPVAALSYAYPRSPLPISFGNPFTKRSVDYLADPSPVAALSYAYPRSYPSVYRSGYPRAYGHHNNKRSADHTPESDSLHGHGYDFGYGRANRHGNNNVFSGHEAYRSRRGYKYGGYD